MSVRIVYYGYLSELAGACEVVVAVKEGTGARVRELLAERVSKLEGGLIVLVNDVPATLDTVVRAGDTIKVLPHIGGG